MYKVNNRDYILWLVSWYPNKLKPYDGDFIQRHARAAALYTNIQVLHIIRDPTGIVTNDYKEETSETGNLHETTVYYYVQPRRVKLWERYLSHRKYNFLYKELIKKTIDSRSKPRLLHVYIALKAGIIARWISRKYKIAYVATEQWGGYLPEAKPQFSDLSFYLRFCCKKIMREAKSVMVVSNYLGDTLRNLFEIRDFVLIPNVVDKEVFCFDETLINRSIIKQFIHISTLFYQKNPEGILLAFARLKKQGYPFFLHIVGPQRKDLEQLTTDLNLSNETIFHQEMPQRSLAELMRDKDALILYSRYETFGCVIIEANAMGLPVIVSDIPVMHENVKEKVNGVFVKSESPDDLSKKIIDFIEGDVFFDKKEIADFARQRYSYENIGSQIYNWYHQILNE
jgi:glycosyltransferase involved in cell wall biosynthesis